MLVNIWINVSAKVLDGKSVLVVLLGQLLAPCLIAPLGYIKKFIEKRSQLSKAYKMKMKITYQPNNSF